MIEIESSNSFTIVVASKLLEVQAWYFFTMTNHTWWIYPTFFLRNHSRNKKLISQNILSLLYVLTHLHGLLFLWRHFLNYISVLPSVTNLSDYDGDLSFMDDDEIDEITFTNSNQNRRSLTGTSITSISEDRRSISTLNQQNFEEIVKDDEGVFHFKEQLFAQEFWVELTSINACNQVVVKWIKDC